jgi:hypothetical protein
MRKIDERPLAERDRDVMSTLLDRRWWRELCRYLPWKLFGWSFRDGATFVTRDTPRSQIEITGDQRNQLMSAFRRMERGSTCDEGKRSGSSETK